MRNVLVILTTAIMAILVIGCGATSDVVSRGEAPQRQGYELEAPLYGDVESLTIRHIQYVPGGDAACGRLFLSVEYKFNSRGDATQIAEYDADGKIMSRVTYDYDAEGNLTQQAWYNSAGKMTQNKQCTYVDSRLISELWLSVSSSRTHRRDYEYDDQGNRTRERWYNGDVLDTDFCIKYDTAGNMIERASHKADGSRGDRITFTYNSAGDKTGEVFYRPDGEVAHEYAYKYDAEGRNIEFTRVDTAAGKQVITYDVAGHKTEVANYSGDGCKRASEVYEYDSAGDMVEWKSYDGAGNITWRRTYKYDSMGNETLAEFYSAESPKPITATRKEIVYR